MVDPEGVPPTSRGRGRATVLLASIVVAVVMVACGRASESEINQALGITPTPTQSAEQVAAATERAAAGAATREAQLAAGGSPVAGELTLLGDATRGRTQFALWCMQCHGPSAQAPDLTAPDGALATLDATGLLAFVRDGTGHQPRPGPIPSFRVSDQNIADIYAYLEAEAAAP
ncbi:MAG: cytochrome c [Chloroflexota bacterium]|nr:cytochrome c [Chloroflexota bacterium]